MIVPDRLVVGVPWTSGADPATDLIEVGGTAELPTPEDVNRVTGDGRAVTLLAWHVLTHRRGDPRYKQMTTPIPEHAAVGHFDRSRWTDEAWERTEALALAVEAQAVVLQTPGSFRPTAEHAMRLENFVAHAARPGLALAWEWTSGSWPRAKASELCDRLGLLPVVDPALDPIPDGEMVYLRFRGGADGRAVLRDDDLKKAAIAARDRIGWVVFGNATARDDAERFSAML